MGNVKPIIQYISDEIMTINPHCHVMCVILGFKNDWKLDILFFELEGILFQC